MGITLILTGVLCFGLVAALVVVVAVVWMQNRQEDRLNRRPEPVDYVPARQPSSAELQQVRDLLAAGNKIEAIKIYRQAAGVGLKDAKDAVEGLERGEPNSVYATAQADVPPDASGLEDQVRFLLRTQNKLEAIKYYRQQTDADLATAKEAVEAIERGEV